MAGPTVERIAVADGVELHVELDGNWGSAGNGELGGNGPCLVLLNGARHNVRQWDRVIDRLNAAHRTIRIDMRGVGESSAGPVEHNRFEQYADDIVAVCDHLGADRSLLWGTAWGARVALVTAARNPDRFVRVVLGDLAIDPAHPDAQKAGAQAAKVARAAAGVAEVPRVPGATDHRSVDAMTATMAATAHHRDLLPFIKRLTMPTLIITGDHDPNLASSRRALADLSDGRLIEIPLAGHAALRQRPDLIVDLVAPVLAEG